ncbi:hypothetical protein [Janthinobacterium lividum]|uniref:hypothetical protein n=1 Tax=Janthinobacterium lividum TaxID=29581 RepID=UPI0008934533|nr:hypothetical protein [Janthinobacterium lividum]MCC7716661.1 hypothetical protein [Janthinobacterium lividum]OEZ64521.1 hypothetical protein JANLI_06960 [Janthinobacterium lividum]WQE32003.1 hypothetical protein U0004_29350 [Janthinobacterium lividum]STS86002.1 Uncharacterised protein [Janthinobacterium lividum]
MADLIPWNRQLLDRLAKSHVQTKFINLGDHLARYASYIIIFEEAGCVKPLAVDFLAA